VPAETIQCLKERSDAGGKVTTSAEGAEQAGWPSSLPVWGKAQLQLKA